MLAIQKYLEKHGLDKTISDFKLKTRDYGHKILLKYDQLVSPTLMALPEMQDCRGLVLEKGTWKVMCLSFRKFFNAGEGNAAKIDWRTARILEKLDGSMIQVYWDWYEEKWFAATTGTAEGEGEVNNKNGTTFNDLFWETVDKVVRDKYGYSFNEKLLNKNLIYVFELTTPYNIVVKPHGESSATVLTVRNRETLVELSGKDLELVALSIGIPLVKSYDLNATNVGQLLKTLEGMPWHDEGYVVVDADFNRIKIKNPAYVAVHHLKGKSAEHNIMVIIKTNEIEEFAATFPGRTEELYKLKEGYDALIIKLNGIWDELKDRKPKNISKDEQKKYAAAVFEICGKHDVNRFTGMYFGLGQYKVDSVEDYLLNYDDKELYKML
jgi:hypothetical protein